MSTATALELKYTVFPSPLGNMMAVVKDGSLCALQFCEDKDRKRMLSRIGAEHPGSTFQEDVKGLAPIVAKVQDVMSGRLAADQVPLALGGTGFQKKVWQKLVQLPWGRTMSYSQLAARVGKPTAVRAVASCCARNPIVFVVPCHRILRKDGSLGGYYYGLDVKQRLLDREL